MRYTKLSETHVDLTAFETKTFTKSSNAFGLVLHQRADLSPSLVEGDGTNCTFMQLEGENAFRYSILELSTKMRGIYFPGIEFRVDPLSQFNPLSGEDRLGALTLQSGKPGIVAMRASDRFGDAHPFELPIDIKFDDDAPVAFERWSIIKRLDNEIIELWTKQ